jgi:hypothetical protein
MVDATPGRVAIQASATCAGGRPRSRATLISASTMVQFRSGQSFSKPGFPDVATVGSRPSPFALSPWRWYLPVSRPEASGLQAVTLAPSASAAGTCSRSMLRSTSEYSSCSPTIVAKGVACPRPRPWATALSSPRPSLKRVALRVDTNSDKNCGKKAVE